MATVKTVAGTLILLLKFKEFNMTMQRWMETVDFRITEGSTFGWDCYGPNAYTLDSWNGEQDGHSFSIIFDTRDQTVYEIQAHDYANNRAYRWVAESWRKAMEAEAKDKNAVEKEAWDNVNYVDLEVLDDLFEKMTAIKAGVPYDTRVSIPIDFTDEELLKYMVLAHERDMTFNDFIEEALRHAIEKHKSELDATDEYYEI
jgi:hypothetical protein